MCTISTIHLLSRTPTCRMGGPIISQDSLQLDSRHSDKKLDNFSLRGFSMSLVVPFYSAQQGLDFYPIFSHLEVFIVRSYLAFTSIFLLFSSPLGLPNFGGISQLKYQCIFTRIPFLPPADSTHIPPSGNCFCRKSARVSGSVQYLTTDTCTMLHLGFSFHFQFSISTSASVSVSVFYT